MGGSAELRLPTLAVAVDLARAGVSPERVELFVSDVPRRGRSQLATEIAALLEAEPPFVPVRQVDAGGASVAALHKHAILWVAVSLREVGGGPPTDSVPEEVDAFEPSEIIMLFDHRHDVRVELDTGAALEGHVLYSSPADRPRLTDHLNAPVRFLRVWTRDALHLVNKQHVVRVHELT
jgi:hypothetical protein